MTAGTDDKKQPDVLIVGGPTPSGDGVQVVRAREGAVEVGELRPVKEGEPIRGDLVKLKQRTEHRRLFDVEVLLESPRPRPAPAHAGPAKVATEAYRNNWDSIFAATKKKQGDLVN